MSSSRIAGAVVVAVGLALGSGSGSARANIVGYQDVLGLGGESLTTVNVAGSSLLQGTRSWGAYTFDMTASEFSYTIDWHASATPSRSIRQLVRFQTNVSTNMTFDLYKGVWNAGGASNDFTFVEQIAIYDGNNFKPLFRNLATPIIGASAIKVVWVAGTWPDPTRRLPGFVAFANPVYEAAENPLIKLDGATSTVGWAGGNPLSFTYDDTKNVAITTISSPTNAYITYTFNQKTSLSGLMFNLNPIDDTSMFAWHGWTLRDVPDGTILWDQAHNTALFQMFKFPQPVKVLTFTLQGPMNPDTGTSGRGRFGEVWGILGYVPPAGTTITVR